MKDSINQLIELRHWLHAHPEVSGKEKNTAAYIIEFLKSLQPDQIIQNIGGTGILVLFDSGKPGLGLLFRSELDALPIKEINDFAHKSVIEEVSHKCGHDGHSAILCGLAGKLSVNRPASGKVYLLFQPAEETGKGAQLVVNDPAFSIQPDYVFALHNLPGYEAGSVVVKEGLFSAAVTSVIIKLKGKTAHAAEPEMGINPANAISEIINRADQLNNNTPEKEDFNVITPVHISMGAKAYGVSAGDGELHYTLRCWDNDSLQKLQEDLILKCKAIAQKHKLEVSFTFTETFFANNNNKEANEVVIKAAEQLNYTIVRKDIPFKWAEDFGFFTSKYKGCMFGLGSGTDHPALHNPDYDFPDDIIKNGVNIFYTISQLLLKK